MTTTTRNDPLARYAVFALIGLALWASFAQLQPRAEAQDIIIMATPSLPTPALGDDPALVIAPATPELPLPEWPVASQEPILGGSGGENEYLAVVGAQAPHSPRGDVEHPPAFDSGPVLYPDQNVIVLPNAPVEPGIAVAVPALSAEQAAVLGARQSNTCAAGEVFYPRTGCHLEGSGGPMPGAVGER